MAVAVMKGHASWPRCSCLAVPWKGYEHQDDQLLSIRQLRRIQ